MDIHKTSLIIGGILLVILVLIGLVDKNALITILKLIVGA